MSVLVRKIRRDILQTRGIIATILAIIAVGTGSFIALGSAQRILEASQRSYYGEYRFADFWVEVKKAPLPAVERIARLPEVAELNARVVFDVILDMPNVVEPVAGRLISVPARGFAEVINGIHLVRGSGFSEDRDEEIILGEAFAKAHDLGPGDRLTLILNRRRQSFVIVGTAISPEYVYMVRGEGDFVPDPLHFGILYVKERYAREVLDFQDATNQIVGRLVPGEERRVDAVLDRIDRELDAYGVLALTPRENQASHRFLADEIHGLGVISLVMPGIFLVVAALVLNIVTTRLAERQRTTVGTLKALGYGGGRLTVRFLQYGMFIGVLGGVAGMVLGLAMAYGMITIYPQFFEFPRFAFRIYPDLLLYGLAISLFFALLGTMRGAWAVLKLEPAEAMRPTPPVRGGAIFLERFPRVWRRMGFRAHVAIRGLLRSPMRTATGVFSSALATAIVLQTFSMRDSIVFLVDFQYDLIARSDIDLGLREERSTAALFEARGLPGVDRAEPVLGLTCDMRHGRYEKRMSVTGLAPGHRLTIPRERNLTPVEIPSHGLVLSEKLASILHAEVGDWITLTPVRGQRRTVQAPVASTVTGFVGLECYADIRYLSGLVGEDIALNAVQLAVDPARTEELFRAVKELPNVQGVSIRENARENIERTMIDVMGIWLSAVILFAGVIALGSTLNASLVEMAERRRDVATFRVMGYEPSEIAGIFFRQNLLVYAGGLAVGLPLGFAMTHLTARGFDTELFRMPVVISNAVVALTVIVTLGFVLIAQAVVYRQTLRLDWLEAIKVKE